MVKKVDVDAYGTGAAGCAAFLVWVTILTLLLGVLIRAWGWTFG